MDLVFRLFSSSYILNNNEAVVRCYLQLPITTSFFFHTCRIITKYTQSHRVANGKTTDIYK